MNLAKRLVGVAFVATLSASAAAATLPFPHASQEHSNWCWLAATQNMLAYHGVGKSQCELANLAFNRDDACGNTNFDWDHPANKPGALYGSDTGIDKFLAEFAGRKSTGSRGAIVWNDVKTSIDQKLPILAVWEWDNAIIAHVVTLYGYVDEGGIQSVNYSDPAPGEGKKIASYDWFRRGSDKGASHYWSYSLSVD